MLILLLHRRRRLFPRVVVSDTLETVKHKPRRAKKRLEDKAVKAIKRIKTLVGKNEGLQITGVPIPQTDLELLRKLMNPDIIKAPAKEQLKTLRAARKAIKRINDLADGLEILLFVISSDE